MYCGFFIQSKIYTSDIKDNDCIIIGKAIRMKKNEINNNINNNNLSNIGNNHVFLNNNQNMINNNSNNSFTIKNYFNFAPKVGLYDIGAACYMNAILQCFCHIEEFVSYFKFNNNINIILNNYMKSEKYYLCPSFKILIDNLWPDDARCQNVSQRNYKPVEFKEKIYKMSNLINKNSVHDIKDCINIIIITLHEELNLKETNNYLINNNALNNNSNLIEVFYHFYSNFQMNYNSIISKLFYGFQMTQTTCLNCNNSQYNFQTYFYLIFSLQDIQKYSINKYQFQQQYILNMSNSFNINNNMNINQLNSKILNLAKNNVNIFDCFDFNQKIETLTNDNSIYCNNCCQLSQANYSTKLYNTPEILIVIFDRENDYQNIKVEFPMMLDLSNYVFDKNNFYKYKLIGVASNINIKNQNSFLIAHCLSPIDNKWYTYKDEIVTEVHDFKTEILEQGLPYLLFYQKIK